MSTKVQQAVEKKQSGRCNCAQAVAATYADQAGTDEETMMSMGAAFGTGMGCLEGTCGALVGAGLVLGAVHRDRVKAMRAMREVMTAFKQQNGAVTCRELKGQGGAPALRACNDCVADAATLLEKALGQV